LSIFSLFVFAKRAEKIPGELPSESTSSPESSAMVQLPVNFAAALALSNALSKYVLPVSSTSRELGCV
jgi:hypothetical protein